MPEKWEYYLVISETLCQQVPDRLNVWIYQSRALHHLKQDQKALALLEAAVAMFPQAGEAQD